MFTIPAAGGSGIILVARPSASSGTITNAANAYDLPSSRPDDPPYITSADRATVTGSLVAGTPDFITVEYNTFPSRLKTQFTRAQLVIGISANLTATVLASSTNFKTGTITTNYVVPDLTIDYQIDGTTWINLANIHVFYSLSASIDLGVASNDTAINQTFESVVGSTLSTDSSKRTYSVDIPATSFPANLNTLKVRFKLGTCTNSVNTSYKSSGSYSVWDIRANIS